MTKGVGGGGGDAACVISKLGAVKLPILEVFNGSMIFENILDFLHYSNNSQQTDTNQGN